MKTRITEMLNIRYPIIQGGMVHVAEPPLAAAVSNAGGLGILTGSLWTPEELTEAFEDLGERRAPAREFDRMGLGKLRLGLVDGDTDMGSVPAGQIAGIVEDIPTCAELIRRVVNQAQEARVRLNAIWDTP